MFSLVGDVGFMCGGLEPPLAVGASQIRQRASLLEPSTQTSMDVTVDVPESQETQLTSSIIIITITLIYISISIYL